MDKNTREAMRQWTLAAPSVSAFVGALVRDSQDRDDVLQETAVAVLDSFGRYDPAQPFVAWALGIARNQVRTLARKRQRLVALDAAAEEAAAAAFAETAGADPRLEWLAACLEALPSADQTLCRLRYAEDLKPAAIAAQMGVAANTVAKALQRARDRLRACVERKAILAGGPA